MTNPNQASMSPDIRRTATYKLSLRLMSIKLPSSTLPIVSSEARLRSSDSKGGIAERIVRLKFRARDELVVEYLVEGEEWVEVDRQGWLELVVTSARAAALRVDLALMTLYPPSS
jgi:hypothetical protein